MSRSKARARVAGQQAIMGLSAVYFLDFFFFSSLARAQAGRQVGGGGLRIFEGSRRRSTVHPTLVGAFPFQK